MKKNNIYEEKQFYISIGDDDLIEHMTLIDYQPSKILQIIRPNITDQDMLNLFQLNRTKYKYNDLLNIYNNHWLYHASFSPIWHDRIKQYYGWVDYINLEIKFKNDDYLEQFYNKYNYEPDEQCVNIKNKSIGLINTSFTWINFYNKYKNNGLIEVEEDELTELILEPVIY